MPVTATPAPSGNTGANTARPAVKANALAAAHGQHQRLRLTRYSLNKDGTIKLDDGAQFETQINPSEFQHRYAVGYDTTKEQGAASTEPKFAATDAEEVSFSITLDGTGVVPRVPGQPADVKGQLAALNRIVYDYIDTRGEPPYVRVLWGTLIFFGRLKSMNANYTLFMPSGDPLRAKVDMSFVGAMSKSEKQLKSSRTASAKLTRSEQALDGETLPALCQRVYGDATLADQVARLNDLPDARALAPGQTLYLPPPP